MLGDVGENRKIKTFPKPFSIAMTPYGRTDFAEETRKICVQNRHSLLTSLKICKVIILGDVCVGKTCIVNRFCHQVFESNYKATIGVDFEVEKFEILNVPYNLQIWDTAGQERFKCIAQAYYRSAHVVIIVFDLTNVTTLSNSKIWLREALAANSFKPYLFLVGTKKDLMSKASYRVVESYGAKVANDMGGEYWGISSKTGENVAKLFFRVAALAFEDSIAKEGEKIEKTFINSDLVSFKKNQEKNDKRDRSICGAKCN